MIVVRDTGVLFDAQLSICRSISPICHRRASIMYVACVNNFSHLFPVNQRPHPRPPSDCPRLRFDVLLDFVRVINYCFALYCIVGPLPSSLDYCNTVLADFTALALTPLACGSNSCRSTSSHVTIGYQSQQGSTTNSVV